MKKQEDKVEEKKEEKQKAKTEEKRVDRRRMSREEREKEDLKEHLASWKPKTKLGKMVKDKKIKSMEEIKKKNFKILEPEIVDYLLKLESDLLAVGQAKGKFGGGKRRVWRQTQKKIKEGNVPSFSCMAVVGDKNGYVGLGYGKAKETLPAREKAIRKAKLNIIKINRGCGSFDCSCNELHSIPHEIEGKAGSIKIRLMPAPQGTGLVIGDELKKILKLAGIKDVYSKSFGHIRTTINFSKACIDALEKLRK